MNVISVRERPDMARAAIAYFQARWGSEDSKMVYEDCILSSLQTDSLLPEWYLLMDGEKIAGGAGLISNDFISRMDLQPWLCALYVEPEYRGHAYGAMLIDRVRADAAEKGYDQLYLCSDHVGFYEKYGFERIATGYHPWGETSGVFRSATGALSPKVCLFAGSFDPPTMGHLDLIERAARLFERVIVAVMINSAKKGLFPIEERVKLLGKCTGGMKNVTVVTDSGLTVHAARRLGAGVLLRGIRGEGDAGMEAQIAAANRQISGIETLALFTDPKYSMLSSTIVRDVLKHGGPIEGMVPDAILADVYAKRES